VSAMVVCRYLRDAFWYTERGRRRPGVRDLYFVICAPTVIMKLKRVFTGG
jgi:hypothetical protein